VIQKNNTCLVLKEFLRDPLGNFQIRALSRKLSISTTAVKSAISSLEQENLIVKKDLGVYPSYSSNFESDNFRFLKKIGNVSAIRDSGLLKFLVDKYSPDFIVLFGSAAKGEDTASSDIDIFLQAKDARKSLMAYEKKLGRKIHLFCSEDFRKLKEEFKNSILNGIKMCGYIKIY